MGAKMWCCGGSSSSGGSGGGLAAVATADTPTVDLSGDGTAGAPISAAVVVAPEPNGLETAAGGLLVAPSAQAGNTLTVGPDGRLFVPSPTDTTNVTGIAGGAPAPAGAARSVDIDVTEGPADTFTVGARLSPVWGQTDQVGVNSAGDGAWSPGQSLTVTEDGIYLVEAFVYGEANVAGPRASAAYAISGRLVAGGVNRREGVAVKIAYTQTDPLQTFNAGTTTLTWRGQLTAGALVQVFVQYAGTYFAGDGFGASAFVAYQKISD
jgi:hypothetical protein